MRKLIGALFLISSLCLGGCNSGTQLKSLEPNFGNVAGNDDVVLIGSGFKPGMVVHFGKKEAQSVVIGSSSRIMVKTPAGAEGKVDVTITCDDGKTFVLPGGFTYRRDVASGK